MDFRKYLQQCQRNGTQAQVFRKPSGPLCPVQELKNQYGKNGKDKSKAKILDASINRGVWISFVTIEKEWGWNG